MQSQFFKTTTPPPPPEPVHQLKSCCMTSSYNCDAVRKYFLIDSVVTGLYCIDVNIIERIIGGNGVLYLRRSSLNKFIQFTTKHYMPKQRVLGG